ncbi:MAG: M48 family metalloprotease [Planctomycetes bacterium]|nr:M48 family metalloprotease [Planctomycetota bacterium]
MNNMKTTLLLGSLMGLCMLIGHLFLGPQGILLGLLFGGLGNLIAFFYSDKIALVSMGAREVQRHEIPWLFDMIERLCLRAGLPMPRVYVCPQPAPNAFAAGRSPNHAAVAVTQGMLEQFPDHEIEGVIAHELGHIKHRDMLIATLAAVMAGLISYAGYMLMFFGGGNRRDNPLGLIGTLAMFILAPIAALLIRSAISRSREYVADSYAGELSGNPLQLASALARLRRGNEHIPTQTPPAFHNLYIVEPMAASGAMSLFGTHPPIEKRIEALRAQAAGMR